MTDPLGRPVSAAVLIDSSGGSGGTVAYVESAQAVGLHLLTEGQMAAAFQDPPPARTADSQAAPQHPALLDFGAMLAATTNPVEHPAITAALEAGAFGDGEEDVEPIELGLTILLDGVESLVRRLTGEG